jgi:transcriptional regulator with XRE-family HTH domain
MDATQVEKYKLLGLNVAYYRKKCGLTQEQLAELIDADRTHISNVEIARTGVSLDVIFRIADVLEVPVHRLFEFRD